MGYKHLKKNIVSRASILLRSRSEVLRHGSGKILFAQTGERKPSGFSVLKYLNISKALVFTACNMPSAITALPNKLVNIP